MELVFRAWDGNKFIYSDDVGLGLFFTQFDKSMIDQSSGLSDVNDINLFFGDILEFDPIEWGDNTTNNTIIEWDDNYSQISVYGDVMDISEWCTLIGNYRENVELMSKVNL